VLYSNSVANECHVNTCRGEWLAGSDEQGGGVEFVVQAGRQHGSDDPAADGRAVSTKQLEQVEKSFRANERVR
jgi:hypothetical protein